MYESWKKVSTNNQAEAVYQTEKMVEFCKKVQSELTHSKNRFQICDSCTRCEERIKDILKEMEESNDKRERMEALVAYSVLPAQFFLDGIGNAKAELNSKR